MGAILESGIDYITMTMAASSPSLPDWKVACVQALDLIGMHGNVLRPGGWQGYEGIWCGGAFAGERPDGYYCRIPGAWAGKLFGQLYRDEVTYTRFDLQVTYQFDKEDRQYGEEMRKAADAHNLTLVEAHRRKVRYAGGDDGGYTLYIGARTSENFSRLYNKAAESSDEFYARSWRFEIELHGRTATAAARAVWSNGRTMAASASSTVWQHYASRGIQPPWTREDEYSALGPVAGPQTDVDRKLAWLRTQVRPTIRLLRSLVDNATLDEALGIGAYAMPEPPERSMMEGYDNATS